MGESNPPSVNTEILRLLVDKIEQVEQQLEQISNFLFHLNGIYQKIDAIPKLQKQVEQLQKQLNKVSITNRQFTLIEQTYIETQTNVTNNREKRQQGVRWIDQPYIEEESSVDVGCTKIDAEESQLLDGNDREIQFSTMLSSLEFDAPHPTRTFSLSTQEFWELYDRGERDFRGINLTRINLLGRTLRPINFSQANFSQANLSNANLSNANLSNANLSNANLSMVIFYGTRLERANLAGIDCYKADLERAQLNQAKLNQANLRFANLSYADLSGADLSGADLSGAKLLGANLTDAKLAKTKLQNAQLNGAIMPDGTTYSLKRRR